jgi:large subunit ribosomal protein L21
MQAMYAIVETGGKQYRVQPGDTIAVERLAGEPGETLDLERVLLIGGDGERARIGAPGVAGAVVRAEVVEHGRGEKIIVFRYKSKVRYRRKTGHRQALTRVRITDILVDGAPVVTARAEAAPVAGVPLEPEPAAEDMPATAAEAGPPPAAEPAPREAVEE